MPEKGNRDEVARPASNRVKATFRVDPENLAALEQERLKRIAAGARRSDADVSDLLNEFIREARQQNISERLFEHYLRLAGISQVQYESAAPGTTKRPDYLAEIDRIPARFEVKQFDPQPDDFRIGVGTFDPYPALREKIDAARKKFKGLKGSGPCSLVLFNNGKPLVFLRSLPIYGAMLGNLGITFPLGTRTGEGDAGPVTQRFLGGGKMLRYPKGSTTPIAPQNTTISAVIVLAGTPLDHRRLRLLRARREREREREMSVDEIMAMMEEWKTQPMAGETVLRVSTYENPYAAVPLPRSFGRGRWDERFGVDDGGALARLFVGAELEKLENEERAVGIETQIWRW